VSVGHVARAIEASGVPTVTVCVASFAERMRMMAVPRLVSTRHPMGRPMGAPGDVERQTAVLMAALDLLENAGANGESSELPDAFRPGSVGQPPT
jgi:hypothetical protein